MQGVIKKGVGLGRIRGEELDSPCKSDRRAWSESPFKC